MDKDKRLENSVGFFSKKGAEESLDNGFEALERTRKRKFGFKPLPKTIVDTIVLENKRYSSESQIGLKTRYAEKPEPYKA